MVVTVCGKVDHQRLLAIMEAVEEVFLEDIQIPSYSRNIYRIIQSHSQSRLPSICHQFPSHRYIELLVHRMMNLVESLT